MSPIDPFTTQSPYPAVIIPEVDLWTFLFERKTAFPSDKVIFHDAITSRSYTFHEIKETAIAFGNALRAQWDWQKGDVVGVASTNCIDTPALIFGTLWANGVISPLNPAYSAEELAFQLRDSGAKAVLTQVPLLKIVREAAKKAGIPRDRILVMGDERSDGGVLHFKDFTKASGKGIKRRNQQPGDLAYIPYSSGTTGLPKGVMLTQRNLVSQMLMVDTTQKEMTWNGGPDRKGDSFIGVLPFYHQYGLALFIHWAVWSGVKCVVLPSFNPDTFCQTIQTHKITYGYVVPPIVLFLSKSPIVDNYDISSIKVLMSAAAPLTSELVRAVWKRHKIPVKQGYGLSETSPATHLQRTADWESAIGSVGKLLPNQTLRFVKETGELLKPGKTGEIWVKGPNVFAGYWRNPAATTNCMTADGYFKTGDIGHQDKDGNLYITDRLKELIKYKGFQVAPAELEGLLVGHDKVADACVLGVYDRSVETELPRAYVVKAEGLENTSDKELELEIRTWVDGRVANHKRLRGGVRFVKEIPKSAAGKILRRILRDQMLAEKKVKSKL